ncbi:hypothetical protein BP6252_12774 [Coleophoma cylindrospora]|uniref:Uncharacterized protein n=1 Tax=Coleophoma cylindrospora TaxID=1849047 RepID=A0A3D8QD98_9HELO|nr:hypothetical protein BP6252_12774 [Coleophoma cylindrospora]
MTPNITLDDIKNRPLWDPDPEYFVAKEALNDAARPLSDPRSIKRVNISDFLIVAFAVLIKEKYITITQVDKFETVYVAGARVRQARKTIPKEYRGRAARAPDAKHSIIKIREKVGIKTVDILYSGSEDVGEEEAAGMWDLENIQDCPGYAQWVEELKRAAAVLFAKGYHNDQMNTPFSSPAALAYANKATDLEITLLFRCLMAELARSGVDFSAVGRGLVYGEGDPTGAKGIREKFTRPYSAELRGRIVGLVKEDERAWDAIQKRVKDKHIRDNRARDIWISLEM